MQHRNSKIMKMGHQSLNVVVIGAGMSGLVAARELQREGHQVVVLEKRSQLGGTWDYDPRVETDLLGLDPGREIIHSSLYASLHTNVRRQLMGFLDYSFPKAVSEDVNNFPHHEEVLAFLKDFADEFGLRELIQFETDVVQVKLVANEWVVKSLVQGHEGKEEVFDAVVVCNGHYTQPRISELPGINRWPGEQIHSHNYRIPEPFQDKVVVVIGNSVSANDISREISAVAKEVHLSSRSAEVIVEQLSGYDNIWQHSKVKCTFEDSTVVFEDGSSVQADTIFYCTGYCYHYPFLETNGIITVDDNRVGPLYKHVFPPQLAPRISFLGIPMLIIPFMTCELQSRWVAQVLSGKVFLPSEAEMKASVREHYKYLEDTGKPKHYTHILHSYQFEYQNWLAAQIGIPPLVEHEQLFFEELKRIKMIYARLRDD